jgi:prophage DNA circulation protein
MARFDTIFPFSKLRQGKFRNIEFFTLKDGDTSGGRKTVTHEYPNSDRRFVEDLGGRKEIYNLELYTDTTSNFNQRDSLKKALNEKGTGKLVHPFFGQKTVTVKGWTLFNDFGWSRFNVTFEQSDPSVLPQLDSGNKSLLDKLKDQVATLQESRVGEVFDAVGSGFKTFTRGVDKVNDFSKQMLEVSNAVLNSTSAISDLQNTINDTIDNVALLVKTPTELATRISNIFAQFEVIGERTIDQFNATKGLFGFGEDDSDVKTDTANQRLIISNNNVLNINIRSNALALGYITAVDINYNNNEELEEVVEILENEYQSLILIVDDDTLDLLRDLRSQARLVFENLQKTVPNIYTVNLISQQNIHQIVYNYYGNFANSTDFEDKVEQIWTLNEFTNPSKIRGEIKLLT